jgi:hypothetical protein
MRAFILTLLFAAAPIYLGSAVFGDNPAFSLSNFNLSDIRDNVRSNDLVQDLRSSDFAHNAMTQARDYATAHPGLVDALKAHRGEIEQLRSEICASARC